VGDSPLSACRNITLRVARRRRLPAAVLVAVCLLSGAAVPATAFAATSPSSEVVSAMNGFDLFGSPSSVWGAQLALMRSEGVTTVRSDASWAVVGAVASSSSNPPLDWSSVDPWVAALAAAHLSWLPVIDDTPAWAKSCAGDCPPESMAWYATFAQKVAARYGPGGSFWSQNPGVPYEPVQFFEIWNEENGSQFWSTGPNPAQYASMYSAARSAIRVVDPAAQVIVGGLGNGDADWFVQQMFAAMPGLRGNVDGFGLHPYDTSAATDMSDVESFRSTLEGLGEGSVPIDLTEFGWQTGSAAQELWRATQLAELSYYWSNSNCGLRILAPYTWYDPQDSPGMGLVSSTTGALLNSALGWFKGLAAGRGGRAGAGRRRLVIGKLARGGAGWRWGRLGAGAGSSHWDQGPVAGAGAGPFPVTARDEVGDRIGWSTPWMPDVARERSNSYDAKCSLAAWRAASVHFSAAYMEKCSLVAGRGTCEQNSVSAAEPGATGPDTVGVLRPGAITSSCALND
jgi:hypothetical protein